MEPRNNLKLRNNQTDVQFKTLSSVQISRFLHSSRTEGNAENLWSLSVHKTKGRNQPHEESS